MVNVCLRKIQRRMVHPLCNLTSHLVYLAPSFGASLCLLFFVWWPSEKIFGLFAVYAVLAGYMNSLKTILQFCSIVLHVLAWELPTVRIAIYLPLVGTATGIAGNWWDFVHYGFYLAVVSCTACQWVSSFVHFLLSKLSPRGVCLIFFLDLLTCHAE